MRYDDRNALSRPLLRPIVRSDSCVIVCVITLLILTTHSVFAQTPPVFNTVFPASGQNGTTVDVTVTGSNLERVTTLRCSVLGVRCELLEPNRFRLTIPPNAQPGLYDLWAVGDNGVSAPRTFAVGNRVEHSEVEPNDSQREATIVPLDSVVNGQLNKGGDVDQFQIEAKKGQRLIIEGWAERIDSPLRLVLELFDSTGRRVAVNRGYFGSDPLLDFRVPVDGTYVVAVHDLISTGGVECYYRLDIDTGPRVAFSVPSVIERGKTSRVQLYGWNLNRDETSAALETEINENSASGVRSQLSGGYDSVEVEIPAALAVAAWPLPVQLQPSQAILAGAAFCYHFPRSHAPIVIGLADVPVSIDRGDNSASELAQAITVPCDLSGQLAEGAECDWYAIEARRGEVFFIEAFGQRIGSPVDLQISIHDGRIPDVLADAQTLQPLAVLAQFADETRNLGGAFPTNHLDPAGRWVSPEDGRFLIAVQNLSGGLRSDLRRLYRLRLEREEPDFQVVAIPLQGGPGGLNLQRGGRAVLELLAVRRRGWGGSIRVSAKDLPSGVECADVWLGPGVDRTLMVVSADQNAEGQCGALKLEASAEVGLESLHRAVHGGTVVRSRPANGWGRIVSEIPLAVVGASPLKITADGHGTVEHQLYGTLQARHSPGGVVDLAVQIERREPLQQASVKLIGVGLPELIPNESAIIPAGQTTGYLSFLLPTTLPVGRYSLAIRAETTVPTADAKTETIFGYSNSVTIDVQPAAFHVEVDPFSVKQARRGETIQIAYSAKRLNGFIGKMHTELAAPGCVTDVAGLRGRGETFVGQTDAGSLQIVINDDAALGPQPFLRLFTVGVIEDEPSYHGSSFFSLEILP